MKQSFSIALEETETALSTIRWKDYEEVLFLSKSLGTVVASAYGKIHGLMTRNVYFTPVKAAFSYMEQPGIVFHGTADSWVDTDVVKEGCERGGYPLTIIPEANHSLETGDGLRDLEILREVMEQVHAYLFKG